jgi:hypothetical protein
MESVVDHYFFLQGTNQVIIAFYDDVPDNIQVILTIAQQTISINAVKLNSKTVYFQPPSEYFTITFQASD